MYCLLCHEKIPRLRAWRTKSEFCSDEHAAQYKKQTLDRLLTDQNPARKEKPAPIALSEEERDPFLHDEMATEPGTERESAQLVSEEAETAAVFSDAQAAEIEAYDLPIADHDDLDEESHDGVEELWRMAEHVEHSDSDHTPLILDDDLPEAPRQSAEEALQALRMLAAKGSRKDLDSSSAEDAIPAADAAEDGFSIDSIEDLPPIGDDLMAELEGGFSLLDVDSEDRAPKRTPQEADRRPPVRDEEPPSILERLMEDPTAEWRKPANVADSSESNPEPVDDQPDPLADFDEFPEPEFAFQDDAFEAAEPLATLESEPEEAPEPAGVTAEEPEELEPFGEDDLAELEAALADQLEDPEIDPLAELIKAEANAKAAAEAGESDDDLELDEAVADQLVNELAEEAFRDDLDLQELERSLKVVPFPSPDREPAKNGRHSHADEIVAKAEAELDPSLDSPIQEPEPVENHAKSPSRRSQPQRPGRQRTKFKPSMVMAGIEPSLQGYLQGDPLESWRGRAVESAWGERGGPDAHSFEVSPADFATLSGNQLQALRPERRYRPRLGVSAASCTPAQAQEFEPPSPDWKPRRPEPAQQGPRSLSAEPQAWIGLGPEYRPFSEAALVGIQTQDVESLEIPQAVEESSAGLRMPLAPGGLFFDSVSPEDRFVDEEDWEEAAVSNRDPSEGIDLSDDFATEQPAAQSSGGRRGR